jgi:hypothetical protein
LTHEPLEPAPVDYAAPRAHDSPRPTSVTVLAGIGIALGSLGVLCKLGNALVSLLMPMPQPNPVIDAIRDNPTIRTFVAFSAVTGTLISMLLLLSSLGSLALKGWGRAGMLAYAALALLMTAVEQTVNSLVVGPEMLRVMRQSGMPQPAGMALMSGWVGVAINLLVRLWYPALILYYYNRRHVKEAFLRGLPGKGI